MENTLHIKHLVSAFVRQSSEGALSPRLDIASATPHLHHHRLKDGESFEIKLKSMGGAQEGAATHVRLGGACGAS